MLSGMVSVPFLKMHGLGNDFVVIDARSSSVAIDETAARRLADRREGIGCDQLIVLERGRDGGDAFMRIRNADGGEVEACGNAARCVARLLMDEGSRSRIRIETASGPVEAEGAGEGRVRVDLGPARTSWSDIPVAEAVADTTHLPLIVGPLSDPVGVNVGNPHAVFFVADAEAVDLSLWGPRIETHPLFPQRTNVEVATVLDPSLIRMRVWERGVGITRACGTGAAATLVAAVRRRLSGGRAEVRLDGGPLDVEWRDDGHVVITGPVAVSFKGRFDEGLLRTPAGG
jgi:diaminopimelate epimerase